jgi:hypothetical protein
MIFVRTFLMNAFKGLLTTTIFFYLSSHFFFRVGFSIGKERGELADKDGQ